MRLKAIFVTVFLGAVACVIPAFGHHSFAMFAMTKNVTYDGVVLEFHWENPHSHIIVKVAPGPGVNPATVGTWDIEGAGPNIMVRQGWNKTTFKPGDPISATGHPMRDGSKGVSLFYVTRPNGSRLYMDIARPSADGSDPGHNPNGQ